MSHVLDTIAGHGGADTEEARDVSAAPVVPVLEARTRSGVQRWKREEYPAIKARAAEVGATILFADEASVRTFDEQMKAAGVPVH